MKKIFASILIIIISITFILTSMPKKVYAQDQSNQIVTGAEQYMVDFLEANQDRTSFSEGEAKAAQWLKQKFDSFSLSEAVIQNFESEYDNKNLKSQNVIWGLDNKKQKQVIICAHYDNIYGSDVISGYKAEGAYNNASGIGVMLALADYFSKLQTDLDYNILFIALGAEEPGLLGSKYYESKMLPSERDNTLLVIDLDCVGGGDYLYLYCDELETVHEKFIKNIADKNNKALRLPPSNKKTFTAITPLAPYLHYGLNSANINFLKSGINSVHFFSRNWHTNNKIGAVESEKHPSIIYTADDTLKTLTKYYGDTYIQKMNSAADIVYYTLTDKDFVSTMEKSSAEKKDYSLLTDGNLVTYIKLGLLIIMGVIVFLLTRRFMSRYPVPIIKIRQVPPAVFGDEYENKKGDNSGESNNSNKTDHKNPFDGY